MGSCTKRKPESSVQKLASLCEFEGGVLLILVKRATTASLGAVQSRVPLAKETHYEVTFWSYIKFESCILKLVSTIKKAYVIHKDPGAAPALRDDNFVPIINSI